MLSNVGNTEKKSIKIKNFLYFPDQEIGRGAFATVYLGRNEISGEAVAVKKIKISELQNRLTKLWSEIKIMKQLAHPNIIKLYDIHLDLEDEALYMFLEYCNQGDLSQYVKKKILTEKTILSYFDQIRQGLEYLHGFQVLHRDLKPQNILIHDDQIKICDFGLSTLADQNTLISTMCGSPLYMAPEIIQHETYTIKSDLWSLGVILYELFYHKHPYESSNYYELTQKIKQDIRFPANSRVSPKARNLLKGLLQKDHELRLNWNHFFNHPWFSNEDTDKNRSTSAGGRLHLSTDSNNSINNSDDTDNEVFKFSGDCNEYENTGNNLKDSLYYSCESDGDGDNQDAGITNTNTNTNTNNVKDRRSTVDTEVWMRESRSSDNRRRHDSSSLSASKKLGISHYIVKDYQKSDSHPMRSATYTPPGVAQSAPVSRGNWSQLASSQSRSPNQSQGYNSVGSKLYKYMYKSYNVVKNSFES